jgi:hypothetical protein
MALGLAVAGVLAVWWLAATRLAILGGLGAELTSAQLLYAAWLLRAMLVALAGPRAAAVGGYVAGLRVCLPIVAVAWPLVALAWLASSQGLVRALTVEAGLVGIAAAAPFFGRLPARLMKQGPGLESLAAAAGVLLAVLVWWLTAALGSS